jgi:hypothetical protein
MPLFGSKLTKEEHKMNFWQWLLGYFVTEWMENDKENTPRDKIM